MIAGESVKTEAEKGSPSSRRPPYVAGLVCGINIAWDPYRRVSIHGIFSSVPAPTLPFEFPQPIYIVASLVGIEPGQHAFGARPQPGVIEFSCEPQVVSLDSSLAVVMLSMVNCLVLTPGPQNLTLTVDDEPMEPAFAFQVQVQEQEDEQ